MLQRIFLMGCFVLVAVASDDNFDYYIFTQIYPTSVCRADDDTVPASCLVPKGSANWTLHGLWPTRNDGSYPKFCKGHARKFNASEVQSLESQLLIKWPNLYPTQSETSLWKHEWEKHGSCAVSVPSVSGEKKYFSAALGLHEKFPIYDALRLQGVEPTLSTTFSLDKIMTAIKKSLSHNKRVQIHCLKDKKTKEWLLGDIRICVDKEFLPIDCPEKGQSNNDVLPAFQPCPPSDIHYINRDTKFKLNFMSSPYLYSLKSILSALAGPFPIVTSIRDLLF